MVRAILSLLVLAATGASAVAAGHLHVSDKPQLHENKLLRKHFGFELPASAKISIKLKTPRSKVTYLFVSMPSADARSFRDTLWTEITSPKNSNAAIEDADCVVREGFHCPKIGMVMAPQDRPEELIERWWSENKVETSVIAHIHTSGKGRIKSFASMFLDVRKGFLLLWYKP